VYTGYINEENSIMQGLRTGQVAKQAGVTVETLRYYERTGLIDAPPRTASGYRAYPAETVSRLRFIRRAQALGFTLQEIGELLSLRLSPTASSAAVKAHAQAKMADIEAKIRTLTRMQETLASLIRACDGCAPLRACPILDALEAHERSHDDGNTNH
jgi:MerR family copper efflux transcriptional regulator